MAEYPPGKPIINLENLQANLLHLDFDDQAYNQQFVGLIGNLRDRCTEGGALVGGKRTVHGNPHNPLVLVRITLLELETLFLVHKDRFYIFAMTINREWYLCNDSPYAINGASGFGFNSSYQQKKVNNFAGPGVLTRVVNMLSGGQTAREKAFTSLCLHFSEPCRFTDFENFIADLMLGDNLTNEAEFSAKLLRMKTCWSDLSDAWRDWCLTEVWTLSNVISGELDIQNADQLDRALAVLCP